MKQILRLKTPALRLKTRTLRSSFCLLSRVSWVVLSMSLLCHWLWAADSPQSLAIRAGKIWTLTNGVITNGVIVIKDGKIDAVGENPGIPKNAKILEMPDKSVMPGLIDAHSHLGLSLDILGEIEETVLAITPDMHILDTFNPLADDVRRALRSGVTTVLLAPGYENPIAGQTAIVKLHGAKGDDWLLETREELTKLPGVGDYVAGAVLSIAYGKKEWIVDSNIVRLFRKYFGIKTSKEGRRDKHVIEMAKIYVSARNPRKANLAILDFAALVCTSRKPDCEKCPLREGCHYLCPRLL